MHTPLLTAAAPDTSTAAVTVPAHENRHEIESMPSASESDSDSYDGSAAAHSVLQHQPPNQRTRAQQAPAGQRTVTQSTGRVGPSHYASVIPQVHATRMMPGPRQHDPRQHEFVNGSVRPFTSPHLRRHDPLSGKSCARMTLNGVLLSSQPPGGPHRPALPLIPRFMLKMLVCTSACT